MIRDYIALIRAHQYLKNVFIFFPLFFGLRITELDLLMKCFVSFISFSFVASSVYIFNDYKDIEEDRCHPKKKYRPMASGAISKRAALFTLSFFLILGLGISLVQSMHIFYILVFYSVLNVLYSIKLKYIAIIDVFVVASGFVIRLWVGSVSSNVSLSIWIILTTFLLSLFLALAKRRDDVLIYQESGVKTRKVIDGYNLELLNGSMFIMASIVIVSYIMYTVSPEVMMRLHTDKLYVTVVFVMLGVMRYLQLSFVQKKTGSPTEVLLKDRFIQLTIAAWLLTFGIILYA